MNINKFFPKKLGNLVQWKNSCFGCRRPEFDSRSCPGFRSFYDKFSLFLHHLMMVMIISVPDECATKSMIDWHAMNTA